MYVRYMFYSHSRQLSTTKLPEERERIDGCTISVPVGGMAEPRGG